MSPTQPLLEGLASRLGSALAFADDISAKQLRTIGSRSTKAALGANARSFMIGDLRSGAIDQYRLLEAHTERNKVALQHINSHTRFWLKSQAAVGFTFESPGDKLFEHPSTLQVLTFAIDGELVEFWHAPISKMKNKKFRLETSLSALGRFPLGGSGPPGGYPSNRSDGIFDSGLEDTFDDLFGDGEEPDEGEASA